jgi:hypothetical protein
MNRRLVIARMLVMFTACATLALDRAALAQAALPSGKDVLEKYLAATGGREAYEKITSRVTHATMDAPALGIKGKVTIMQVAPNKGYVFTDITGVGTVEQGSDGTIVWEKSAMMGPRLVDGQERESLQRSLTINGELFPDKFYKSIETVGVEDIDGRPCYKVEIVTLAGGKETRFYDKETALLMKTNAIASTQMGEIPIVATATDYRDVDGIKMPFKATQEMMGRTITVAIEKIEQNVEVPADKLQIPTDVKTLAEKAATAPASGAK